MSKKKIPKNILKKIKDKVADIGDKFEKLKEKKETKLINEIWELDSESKVSPLQVVREFIMRKGLKLYGGLALHEHLKKVKDPIYSSSEFPDYDVYSPNAWEHAKELCNILFNMGFYFVEARSSILNDEHHQTYKVAVDMVYILDLTQVGCEPKKIKYGDCASCGSTKDGKCISIFNHMPCVDIKSYNLKKPVKYTKVYNYDTDTSLYPNKMFLLDADWLKISMYRELTEPLSQPSRIPKVASRLAKFEYYFEYDHSKCTPKEYTKMVKEEYQPVLDHIGKFIKKHKLINYGVSAYNFFIKNNKYKFGSLPVSDYEVYMEHDEDLYQLAGGGKDNNSNSNNNEPLLVGYPEKLLDELSKKYPQFKFKIQRKLSYWKEIDIYNYVIVAKQNKPGGRYNNLITLTKVSECMPYIQYNGVRYATFDRIKYLFYRAVALPEVMKLTEVNPLNYECLLSNLIKLENDYLKKNPDSKRGKFRRFVGNCVGEELPKIKVNLFDRFASKIESTKKTKISVDYPKKGHITKSYPMPQTDEKFPYKPAELLVKNYKNYSKKVDRYIAKKNKKKKKTLKHANIL